jgi:membrane-associated phospholipid phosphatase
MQPMNHILFATAGLVALTGSGTSLVFPLTDFLKPFAFCIGLFWLAGYYDRRGEASFSLVARSLMTLIAFSTIYSMLTYCVAAQTPYNFADQQLAQMDGALGLSADQSVKWVYNYPTLGFILYVAYFSIIPQTLIFIAYFGFKNDQRVTKFLTRFMLCALVTVVGFYFYPAKGNVDHDVPAYYSNIIEHLETLHNGTRNLVTWRDAEGLITFPSFHTIWGVLLIVACYKTRLFVPALLLNVTMIASTIPIGRHYYVDVIGGLMVAAVVITYTTTKPHWSWNDRA